MRVSGFLAPPCIARCVGGMLAGYRWTAGGALARTGDPRTGVVYDRIWSDSIHPLGQLRQAACSEAELFFWEWHLVRLSVLVVYVHRGDSARVGDYVSRPLTRGLFRFE